MAQTKGRKTSSSSNSRKKTTSKNTRGRKPSAYDAKRESELFHEIGLIIFFLIMLILFLCNFGIIGPVGNAISGCLFGLFGILAYVFPIILFLGVCFWYANAGNPNAVRKLLAAIVLFLMVGVVCELIFGSVTLDSFIKYDIKALYSFGKNNKSGGGVVCGSITYVLHKYLETIGTVLVVILLSAVSFILFTEKSLLSGVRRSGQRMREFGLEESERRREYSAMRRQQQEELREKREEERRQRAIRRENEKALQLEAKENEKILRMDKKVTGVAYDTSLPKEKAEKRQDNIHEITYNEEQYVQPRSIEPEHVKIKEPEFDFDKIRIRTAHQVSLQEAEQEEEIVEDSYPNEIYERQDISPVEESQTEALSPRQMGRGAKPVAHLTEDVKNNVNPNQREINKAAAEADKRVPKKYIFPPLSRLAKGTGGCGDSPEVLKETAMRLQQTLNLFGVKVTITDISQGPAVTRYELLPEPGTKVSKILSLQDDIKLNLAATDVRIEAPIPGKSAIGIEVPNKENSAVALRDLLETKKFKEFPSNIAFAVGKDISGETIVADIAKMPHMLIAGSTGSGKSVCINTLIMSILYKAHPEDVKLILVDPKVVELSMYNGIPHLLIPVVTDPKKASGALNWAVSEMMDRYAKFADCNVKDIKGYNQKLEGMRERGEENVPGKMPQIVFIVDELADLMMIAGHEVEEAICRLAQLARAAGIHLVIATQRPSVDVITGLIKANMPSRIAFAVSSGVDSRTILDMNGAEKLLGKGDMLFFPQGLSKPIRVQGAFVSEKEVSDVVDFLKNQAIGNVYSEEIEEKMKSLAGASSTGGAGGGGLDRDELFEQAARFIIEKDKASIGMLQRMFKIGFNRAARIMDQLCEYGVVGEEEGTKPRKILMSSEQFEQLVDEVL